MGATGGTDAYGPDTDWQPERPMATRAEAIQIECCVVFRMSETHVLQFALSGVMRLATSEAVSGLSRRFGWGLSVELMGVPSLEPVVRVLQALGQPLELRTFEAVRHQLRRLPVAFRRGREHRF